MIYFVALLAVVPLITFFAASAQKANSLDDELLQKYREISTFKIEKRKEIFNNISPEEKSGLFRVHLILQLNNRPSLNQRQRDLIQEAIYLVTPEIYKLPKKSPQWITLDNNIKALREKILEYFSKKDAKAIFSILGDENPTIATAKNKQLYLQSAAYDEQRRACSCSLSSDWCDTECRSNSTCVVNDTGCGFFWAFQCNGRCIGEVGGEEGEN